MPDWIINKDDVPEERQEWSWKSGSYTRHRKHISVALGNTDEQHPFDVELTRLPPSTSPCPVHAHTHRWEFFIVMSGQAIVVRGGFADTLKTGVIGCCASNAIKADRPLLWKFWQEPERVTVFRETSISSGAFLLKWLSLAFVIESLMVAYLPPEYVGQVLGSGDWWTVPASTVVGIPAYLNGFAAIPMVARLVEMGAAPGAALAFLTAGAVTSIPAAMGVFALVRKSVFIAYIFFGVAGSLAAGYTYQAFFI